MQNTMIEFVWKNGWYAGCSPPKHPNFPLNCVSPIERTGSGCRELAGKLQFEAHLDIVIYEQRAVVLFG